MNGLLLSVFIMSHGPILSQVAKNNPSIKLEYSINLVIELEKASTKYKIPVNVLSAIAMTESSYKLDSVNAKSNDYGIFQVNQYNIDAYKLDKERLLTDLAYSVDSGAKVFSWFYKRYPLDHAIQAYNGGTAKGVENWASTKKYLAKVKKFM